MLVDLPIEWIDPLIAALQAAKRANSAAQREEKLCEKDMAKVLDIEPERLHSMRKHGSCPKENWEKVGRTIAYDTARTLIWWHLRKAAERPLPE